MRQRWMLLLSVACLLFLTSDSYGKKKQEQQQWGAQAGGYGQQTGGYGQQAGGYGQQQWGQSAEAGVTGNDLIKSSDGNVYHLREGVVNQWVQGRTWQRLGATDTFERIFAGTGGGRKKKAGASVLFGIRRGNVYRWNGQQWELLPYQAAAGYGAAPAWGQQMTPTTGYGY